MQALQAQIGAEDTALKTADDTERQANSGQNVQDEQNDGQKMNEDPDSVQPALQDFRYPWKLVSPQLTNAKGESCAMRYYTMTACNHVNDNQDRECAKLLDWAIKKHSDIAQDAL